MIEPTDKNKLIATGVMTEEDDYDILLKYGLTKYGPKLNEITVITAGPESMTYTGIDALRKVCLQNPNELIPPYKSYDLMIEYYYLGFEKYYQIYLQNLPLGSTADRSQAESLFLQKIKSDVNEVVAVLNQEPIRPLSQAANEIKVLTIIELNRFLKWIEDKTGKKEIYGKNEIAMELIGLVGGHNTFDTLQPVFYYIKGVLEKHRLTILEAKEIVNDFKGSVSTEWNKNVIPYIIEYLDSIPSSKINVGSELQNKSGQYDEKIFASAKGFKIFNKLMAERPKTRYKDYCVFIIRKLVKDDFILDIKAQNYRDYLYENYTIEVDKFKALSAVTTENRLSLYKTVRDSIQ